MYQTIGCPNSDHITNPHHCQHLKSCTKYYWKLKFWWKSHIGENWITEQQYILWQYLISHSLSTTVNTVTYCVSKNRGKKNIFNINTHFTIRTTYFEFQTSTTVIWQGNLTADCEIKQHIWQWKDNEDCSRSAAPSVIITIWMTVTTT